MEATGKSSALYSPKTEHECNQALRLLDGFEEELRLTLGGSGEFGWPSAWSARSVSGSRAAATVPGRSICSSAFFGFLHHLASPVSLYIAPSTAC
jgi:hypothetical protein